jgi:hypothetical protein
LCFFLCTPWPWAPARLNSSASPAEEEPVNEVPPNSGRGIPEQPNSPEKPHSAHLTNGYHNNSTAFLLPTCGEVPWKLRGAKGATFSEGLSLIDPHLPGSGASIAPEVLPRRHSLLMGSCKERGLEIVRTQAHMPFPPRGSTDSDKRTGYFRYVVTMPVRGTLYSQNPP